MHDTIPMNLQSKERLFQDNHPIVRELRQIPEIIFEEMYVQKTDCLPLKELFRKKNMDRYHVDCLILQKMARNMVKLQKKLRERGIFPGLYSLEDLYVDLSDSALPIYLIHPEKFQLLQLEQEYEWYPEDERALGEITFFGEDSQLIADNRLLYKILIGSTKGNVKMPPRACSQDYSALFFGTLPPDWRERFEKGEVLSLETWERELNGAIALEEAYEKKQRLRSAAPLPGPEPQHTPAAETVTQEPAQDPDRSLYAMLVLLRREKKPSLEISRMLYQLQEEVEQEMNFGHISLYEGFVFGDGAVCQKPFQKCPPNFRVQLPGAMQESSMVETLLYACAWMEETRMETEDPCRMYVLTDDKIENNAMFQVCLQKIKELKDQGVTIHLQRTKEAVCEGWQQMERILSPS